MTLILMMTGGNSGSTAGGAKTTTILLVLLTAASILKGEENVHIFGRRIENDLLRRACSIVVVYLRWACWRRSPSVPFSRSSPFSRC